MFSTVTNQMNVPRALEYLSTLPSKSVNKKILMSLLDRYNVDTFSLMQSKYNPLSNIKNQDKLYNFIITKETPKYQI